MTSTLRSYVKQTIEEAYGPLDDWVMSEKGAAFHKLKVRKNCVTVYETGTVVAGGPKNDLHDFLTNLAEGAMKLTPEQLYAINNKNERNRSEVEMFRKIIELEESVTKLKNMLEKKKETCDNE